MKVDPFKLLHGKIDSIRGYLKSEFEGLGEFGEPYEYQIGNRVYQSSTGYYSYNQIMEFNNERFQYMIYAIEEDDSNLWFVNPETTIYPEFFINNPDYFYRVEYIWLPF